MSKLKFLLQNDLRSVLLGILYSLSFFSSVAHAARPMITDDARIIDPKSCQVESWAKSNRHSTEFWALPACNPFGFFELTIGGAITNEKNNDRTYTSDGIIQFKTLFRELKTNDWSVGLALGNNRHPGMSIAGTNHSDVYGYIPLTISFNDDRQFLHLNAGLTRKQLDGNYARTWGIGGEFQVLPNTYVIAETYGENRITPAYQAGVRHWIIPNRLQIDVTGGNQGSIGNYGQNRWFSIGIRYLSPAFIP